jgi:hypothetical protein
LSPAFAEIGWQHRDVVMAGLDPAIHAFLLDEKVRRGCPAQGRA